MVSSKIRESRKQILQKKFGTKCVICGRQMKNNCYHDVFGNGHQNYRSMSNEEFESFTKRCLVCLCKYHHNLLHQIFHTRAVDVDNLVLLIRCLAKGLNKHGSEIQLSEGFWRGLGFD